MFSLKELAHGETENISHLVKILRSCAVSDLVRRNYRNLPCFTACQTYCDCTACRCRQFELDIACFHWKLVGSYDLGDSGRWIRIGSPRELRYSGSDANRSAPPSS